jgi:hypothetical protein
MSGCTGHTRNGPVNPLTFPFFKERVLAALLATDSAKTGAIRTGLPHTTFCRYVNKLGFRRMYVTDAERAAVMRMRAGGAERVA